MDNNNNNSENKNISSGAEKVEALAKQNEIDRENERAQKRVQAAMEKQQKKQAEQAEKQKKRAELAQKRVAMHEQREAEIARKKSEKAIAKQVKEQEKKNSARDQMTATERREKRRAMRAAKLEKKRAMRENNQNKNRGDNRDKNSIGGWITAVVSLSVIVLTLGTILTVGYFNMQNMETSLGGSYERSVYELMSFVDNLDTDLSKARVANGKYEKQKFLTDVVIDAELCEECLETFPIDMEKTQNLTAFINRVGDYSRTLLNKLAKGGKVTAEDEEIIAYMYKTVSSIKQKLNETVTAMDAKEIDKILDGHSKVFDDGFNALENDVIDMPKMIYDGPFAKSQNSSEIKFIEKMGEVSEEIAKEKLAGILDRYDVKEINSSGDTRLKNIELYNFDIVDAIGRKYSAQMTKKGGVLAMFESYEECTDKNFDEDACVEIAENFLEKAGFSDMEEVWISEAGTECVINFAYEDEDIVCYSDLIKVKVCYERGVVTGIEANSFIRSHEKRNFPKPEISLKAAKSKLHEGFEIQTHRLCLIPVENTETLAYEFSGEYDGNTYYVYIDAVTGEECELFTVVGSNQGRALM